MEESKVREKLCNDMSKTVQKLLKHNSKLHDKIDDLKNELKWCYDGFGKVEELMNATKVKRDDFYQVIEERRAKNQKDLDDLVKRVGLGQKD